MVTPREAVLDAILNSTVHVMGASDQIHTDLLQILFFDAPGTFVDAVACASDSEKWHAIESLLLYTDEGEREKIFEVCQNLKTQEYLTDEAKQIIESICSRMNVE